MKIFTIEDQHEGFGVPGAWLSCGFLRGEWKGSNEKRGVYFSFALPPKWFSQWKDFCTDSDVEGYRINKFTLWIRRNPKRWHVKIFRYAQILSQKVIMTPEEKESSNHAVTP